MIEPTKAWNKILPPSVIITILILVHTAEQEQTMSSDAKNLLSAPPVLGAPQCILRIGVKMNYQSVMTAVF